MMARKDLGGNQRPPLGNPYGDPGSPGEVRTLEGSMPLRSRALLAALLIALGVVAVFLVVFEIVEQTWFVSADAGVIRLLHLIRGVISAVLAALLVGWFLVRHSPLLLVRLPFEEDVSGKRDFSSATRLYARWFIRMRWLAVFIATALIVLTFEVLRALPREMLSPLSLTVAVLAASNLLYTLFLRRGVMASWLLPLQIYGDLVILTLMLHFSGGIENPLGVAMILHVVIAGIVLSPNHCYAVAGGASLLVTILGFVEWAGLARHTTLLLFPHFVHEVHLIHAAHQIEFVLGRIGSRIVLFFLIAYFVTTLEERLREEERRRAASADRAVANQQLLEQALKTTRTGLRVVGLDMSPSWTSEQWAECFSGEARGKNPEGDGFAELDRLALDTLRNEKSQIGEIRVPCDKSSSAERVSSQPLDAVFQVTVAPLFGRDGRTSGVVELVQDVTVQKEAQARALQAGRMAAVGELAGNVAHEVNNPIAIIGAKARLLLANRRSAMSEAVAVELEKIVDLSDRVARIAQGLLSYCRPSGAARGRLDIRAPLQYAKAMIEERARAQHVLIEEHVGQAVPVVKANEGEMDQVFLNLLLNALDAMPEGGKLFLSATCEGQSLADGQPAVAVTVEDTGAGVPEELRAKIFEPFFSTKKKGKGTGLGLPICQGIVGSHGGEILVENRSGSGTRFIVKLPLHPER